MNRFARLLEDLAYAPARTSKLRLLADYFETVPDPDRGWALAALTAGLSFQTAKAGAIRGLAVERVDPVLFALSYDYVGDLAETVALIWPRTSGIGVVEAPPTLSEVVTALKMASRPAVPRLIEGWLDRLDANGRYALLKLITGALRVGVSARLAKTALAEWKGRDVDELEQIWHGLDPPYVPLFDWLEGRTEAPSLGLTAALRPFMLANPLEGRDLSALDPAAWLAEWKWDGIRVQLAALGGERRLYSRGGDDLGPAFPDVVEIMTFEAVLDGELMVVRDGLPAPFADLQQRLNRKSVNAKLLREFPAHVRLYDILYDGDTDVRPLPFEERRRRLEAFCRANKPDRIDLSPLVPFGAWGDLASLRETARQNGIEGLMLKRADSPYVSGRPVGLWFKWKRDPLTADAVLMYAQRGHGKRSSYYSDYTFGVWRDGVLVPVGKAYFGFTDDELLLLDRWVREHTVKSFGPVREVSPGLVLEVAFDSVHRSNRHKSGLALRFPRIHRIRWDKPAAEADRIETLERLLA